MKNTDHIITICLDEGTVISSDGSLLPGVITALSDISRAGYRLAWPPLPDGVKKILKNEQLFESGADEIQTRYPAPLVLDGKASHQNRIRMENGQLQLWSDDQGAALTPPHSTWEDLVKAIIHPPRSASLKRNTRETRISVELNLDGTGAFNCHTGLGFFDHMLEQIARHGDIDLDIHCEGDLHVDEHHTIEDVALALGSALDQAFGDRRGIERYGFVLPMDETRATVALDLSGRPYLVFNAEFTRDKVGDLPTEMVRHFFYSLAMNLRATLHVEVTGENDHHKIEACFKGLARSLKSAKSRTGTVIPSSKGVL
jgi:imidazoleglycerol phosphate dehydratase HisB